MNGPLPDTHRNQEPVQETTPVMAKHRARGWAVAAALAIAGAAGGAQAASFDLTIAETEINLTGRVRPALSINGRIPGPVIRFKEGEDVTINVTNKLDTDTSIHWHGLIVPYRMDGVPGISFPGI